MNRPAIIFDFGNVIAFFDYTKACARLAEPLGLSGDQLLSRVRDNGILELVARYESGQIRTSEFVESAQGLAGLPIDDGQFAAAWADIFWINEPVARIARALKEAGHRLVLGSNTNALHSDHYRQKFRDELACFDRLILSHEVGHLKPSSRFYEACVEAAGLPASDCVFIDDLEENVRGARGAGLRAIHYQSPAALLDALGGSGVEIGRLDLSVHPGPGDILESDDPVGDQPESFPDVS